MPLSSVQRIFQEEYFSLRRVTGLLFSGVAVITEATSPETSTYAMRSPLGENATSLTPAGKITVFVLEPVIVADTAVTLSPDAYLIINRVPCRDHIASKTPEILLLERLVLFFPSKSTSKIFPDDFST